MSLFILTETSAGYALLKSKDKKLFKRDQLPEDASSAEGMSNLYVYPPGERRKIHSARENCPPSRRKNFVATISRANTSPPGSS